jgi:predicted nucleic acid-binding protein
MILADSTIWIDHLRKPIEQFMQMLDNEQIVIHPFIIGEVALGSHHDRARLISRLQRLVQVRVARTETVMALIEVEQLHGKGIGFVDANLLASVRLTPGTQIWTRDKSLHAVAERLKLAFSV